jgi:hypothetical protein
VSATASPGYQAKIQSISLANPALITTVASHTLALGDGVYLANITAVISGVNTVMDGFYMVNKVPVDGSGNLIPNQLYLMDYSGNVFDASGWSSYHATDGAKPISIQLGSKIFNITNQYAVQAFKADGVSASALSAAASVLNNLDVPGSYNTIAWDAVQGAASYNVYELYNGLWGFIGTTQATSFVDNNIKPDFSIVPGTPDTVFQSAGNYPGAVCYFQQRRCFAGTANGPQNLLDVELGHREHVQLLAADRSPPIASRSAWLRSRPTRSCTWCPMSQLIMLTSETEFAEQSGVNGNAVTPTSIDLKPQSYIGANRGAADDHQHLDGVRGGARRPRARARLLLGREWIPDRRPLAAGCAPVRQSDHRRPGVLEVAAADHLVCVLGREAAGADLHPGRAGGRLASARHAGQLRIDLLRGGRL